MIVFLPLRNMGPPSPLGQGWRWCIQGGMSLERGPADEFSSIIRHLVKHLPSCLTLIKASLRFACVPLIESGLGRSAQPKEPYSIVHEHFGIFPCNAIFPLM